MIQTRVLLVI